MNENGYILEMSRNDKIRNLGFLSYNLYIGGMITFSEMRDITQEIRDELEELTYLRQNSFDQEIIKRNENILDDKLVELGCICYSLYIDSKLFDNEILSLCSKISTINNQITMQEKNYVKYDEGRFFAPGSGYEFYNAGQNEMNAGELYGMEPIPPNFKSCECGYKNKAEAKYCGKCGVKLL